MDNYIEFLCERMGEIGSGVPDALRIYKYGRDRFLADDLLKAKKAEVLNYILHSSVIPSECTLADTVVFGYGGIGVILHNSTVIGAGAVIGSNVTIGGGGARGIYWINDVGQRVYAPRIGDNVYIATGAKVLGGIEVGQLSIIGANCVLRDSVPPLSVVAGVPGRIINRITADNCLNYKSTFYGLREVSDIEFIGMILNLS